MVSSSVFYVAELFATEALAVEVGSAAIGVKRPRLVYREIEPSVMVFALLMLRVAKRGLGEVRVIQMMFLILLHG